MSKVVWLLVGMVALSSEVWAERPFADVAKEVRADYREARQEQRDTVKEIASRRQALQQKLADLETELSAVSGTLASDQERLERLSQERDEITEEVSRRLADNRELGILLVNHSRNLLALAERSPYSAERPDRLETLRSFVDPHRVFRLNDLKGLIDLSFKDMAASREKISDSGAIVDRSGNEVDGEIVRLGHLSAIYGTQDRVGYLSLSPASGRLVMSPDPSLGVRQNLRHYLEGETDSVYVDVSGGAAIRQLAHHVTLMEQLRSGGVLVAPILLVGLVALVLTIERLIFLGKVRHNTDDLMTRVTELVENGDIEAAIQTTDPHRHRPTGRVLMAGLLHRSDPAEVIESAMSEVMLRETPRLERFVGALKACAAVAPLLGLLGTVTGMINTFQVITTHGTGDPRLMAGGISEAMVTTQVGLAVAIPVMVVATFLGRRARNLSQDMEEKGLALMGALLRLRSNGHAHAGKEQAT
jgi:biopolymer transport protein ExbB